MYAIGRPLLRATTIKAYNRTSRFSTICSGRARKWLRGISSKLASNISASRPAVRLVSASLLLAIRSSVAIVALMADPVEI